jgi:hypothetical protein
MYLFAKCSLSMKFSTQNFVYCDIEGRTQIEGVWEQGA